MAAITFTITTSATSAGQQLAAAATTMTYSGNDRTTTTIEISPTDGDYVPMALKKWQGLTGAQDMAM